MATLAMKKDSQTGAELLVKSLESQGVEYVFGIPGAKIDKVFDILSDSKIKTVVPARTERRIYRRRYRSLDRESRGHPGHFRTGLFQPGDRAGNGHFGR